MFNNDFRRAAGMYSSHIHQIPMKKPYATHMLAGSIPLDLI